MGGDTSQKVVIKVRERKGKEKKEKKETREYVPLTEEEALRWSLHKAVWKGDVEGVKRMLDQNDGTSKADQLVKVNQRDRRGNTPLHIAIHLKNRDLIHLLLLYGADVTYKNGGGWTPLQEAIASAEMRTVTEIYLLTQIALQQRFEKRVSELMLGIEKLPDFYMEIKWDFKSWVPLLSNFCPSDTYKIWKMGSCVRCDTTIAGFKDLKWVRGNISLLFTGRQSGKVVLLNHDSKKMEYVNDQFQKSDETVSKELRSIMCRTLVRGDLLLKDVEFSQGSKKDKIGEYPCRQYEMSGLKYVTLHRSDGTKSDKSTPRKPRPDEGPALTFEEYFYEVVNFPPGKGTGMIYESERVRKKSRKFKGTVMMTESFPLSIEKLLPLIEVLAPTGKHFDKLKTFFIGKMPSGLFPVQIVLPVFPTIVATVTFSKFEKRDTIDDSLFEIPTDYEVVNVHLVDFIMGESTDADSPI